MMSRTLPICLTYMILTYIAKCRAACSHARMHARDGTPRMHAVQHGRPTSRHGPTQVSTQRRVVAARPLLHAATATPTRRHICRRCHYIGGRARLPPPSPAAYPAWFRV